MLVGTVFSQCIRDLVQGSVDIEDVLIVIDVIGYDFENSRDRDHCWIEYNSPTLISAPAWSGLDRDNVFAVIDDLMFDNKIHTYRHSNIRNQPLSWTPWLELTIPDDRLDDIPQLREAWEQYKFIAQLVRRQ